MYPMTAYICFIFFSDSFFLIFSGGIKMPLLGYKKRYCEGGKFEPEWHFGSSNEHLLGFCKKLERDIGVDYIRICKFFIPKGE